MAGQFRTLIQSVAQKSVSAGTWLSNSGSFLFTDAALINRMNLTSPGGTIEFWAQYPIPPVDPSPPGSAEIRFNIDTSAITLNGDVVGTFALNGLPSGFQILTANIKMHTGVGTTPGDLTSIIRNGFVIGTVDPDAGTDWNLALDVSGGPLAIFLDNYGFQVESTGGNIGGGNWFGNRQPGTFNTFLSGTYDLLGFAFSYDFPLDGEEVTQGQLITITSPGTGPTDLDLTELIITMSCGTVVPIVQTAQLFTFLVPIACAGAGAISVVATGNGTQFSGSVTLGTLTILPVNGSGIYELVPGKTDDTLYSDLRDGTTVDVKIPNPFGKTGLIGG